MAQFDSAYASLEMTVGPTRSRALAALALVFVVSACGAGGAAKSTAAQSRAVARWRAGLLTWRTEMLRALDGISILLETQASVERLATTDSAAAVSLARFERVLGGCAAAVDRLGPQPQALSPARGYAIAACAKLERGNRLITAAVESLRRGSLADLDAATGPLSDGQNEMTVATRALGTANTRAPPRG